MIIELNGIGWNVKLRSSRGNYFITLKKEIILGNGLKKGSLLSYYLVNIIQRGKKRKALLLTLDNSGLQKEIIKKLNSSSAMVVK